VIFDLSSSPYSDIAAAEMLLDLQGELQERGITLKLSNLTGEVRDLLRRDGLDLKFDIGPRAGVESIVRDWSANGGKPVTGRLSNQPQN